MRHRSIRIGTHGSRCSGKTCYFAALYGKRTDGDIAINLINEETVAILESDWQALANGKRPEATAQGLSKELHYSITHQGRISSVLACDYAGALVQRGRNDAPELKGKVYEWMKSCDALFLLVDTQRILAASPEELREQQTEMGLLLAALHKGHRIDKPLALVLTKWDLYSIDLLSPPEETKKAQEFVKQHHLLGEIAKGLELTGKYFQIFPVSAFGGHCDDEDLPPSHGVHPFNTLAPLAWCVERVSQIRRARSKRIATALAVLVACALIAGFFSLGWYAQSMLVDTMRSMNDLNIPTKVVRQQVQSYRTHWNPLAHTRRRHKELDAAYAGYQEKKESADFDTIVEPRANDTKAEREQNLAAYETFLKNWPASRHRVEIKGFLTRARTMYAEEDDREAIASNVETLFREVDALPDLSKRREMLEEFLNAKPRNQVPGTAHDQIDRVEGRLREVIAAIKDQEWRKILTFCEQNAERHALCITKIDEYLTHDITPKYKELAEARKRVDEISWDKHEYEVLRTALDKANRTVPAANEMVALKQQMVDYIDRAYPKPAMKDFVDVWIRWFEKLEQGTDLIFYVDRVDVLPRGYLAHRWDDVIVLCVKLGSHETKEKKLKKDGSTSQLFIKQRTHAIYYKLGDRLQASVVSRWGWTGGPADRKITATITPLTRQVDLLIHGKRAGTLYIHPVGQPELRPYEESN